MILEKVIADSGVIAVYGDAGIEISSVCNDSRKAAQGSLFVAVRGFASDGHTYISSVLGKARSWRKESSPLSVRIWKQPGRRLQDAKTSRWFM